MGDEKTVRRRNGFRLLLANFFMSAPPTIVDYEFLFVNSLTPKSIPAGTKLVLFGRYVHNIYVGIV